MTTAASSFLFQELVNRAGDSTRLGSFKKSHICYIPLVTGYNQSVYLHSICVLPQHITQLEGSREVRKSRELLVALSSNQESVLMSSFCHKPCLLRPANKAPIQEGKTPPTCESHWVFKGLIWDAHIIGILGICFLPCLPKPNPGIFLKPSFMSDGKFWQQYQLDRSPLGATDSNQLWHLTFALLPTNYVRFWASAFLGH